MIKEILKIIYEKGHLSKREISNSIGIQESTLEDVLTLLSSKGYLKRIDSSEEMSECMRCSINKECMKKPSDGKIYNITEKGKNYLKN
ncbi:MAG: winged helix-turn-helix transcriptional regulator [Candidatus Methylarchaceae archaeon HK02M2]|nr:winged helix-turn-helix transcriptional regulator [Candidatus Methylarchaceae archaeon HK02M2]